MPKDISHFLFGQYRKQTCGMHGCWSESNSTEYHKQWKLKTSIGAVNPVLFCFYILSLTRDAGYNKIKYEVI